MDTMIQDLRFAWRSLMRTPGFTATVVVVMALGIGVNTMMFSVVRTILLRDLPFPNPERIVKVESYNAREPNDLMALSMPDYLDMRSGSRSFIAMAGFRTSEAYLTLGGEPERFRSTVATGNLVEVLQVKPELGRWFTSDEQVYGNHLGTVVLGNRIWRERMKADPDVVGQTLKMNGRVRTIVGVMPAGFRFPESSDFYVPMPVGVPNDSRGGHGTQSVARLRNGVTVAQADAEVSGIAAELERRYPDTNKRMKSKVLGYHEDLVRDIRPMMIILMLAVGFVLLIVCSNVANLMLARATTRHREIGVRLALGAGRGRLVRQMLTESVLLALLGGAAGVFVAQWGLNVTLASIPQELPYWMRFGIDGPVLAYTAGLAALAGVLFGIAPALQATSGDILAPLREGTPGGGDSRARRRTRSALVVAEIALAVVLLVGSGLMVRSFMRLTEQRNALDTRGVLVGNVTLPMATYPEEEKRRAFFHEFRSALAALPGVKAVGGVGVLQLGSDSWRQSVAREGYDETGPLGSPVVSYNVATPGYLNAVGLPLKSGRDFRAADGPNAPRVALVSEKAAKYLWPGKEPIGRRFNEGRNDTLGWITVVGVYGDVPQNAQLADGSGEIIVPHDQQSLQTLTWAIKTDGAPAALAAPVRKLLRARDADLPFYESRTLGEHIRQAVWEPRIYASLMAAFSAFALVIAALGIYGVMAYSVAQRTREIGIRMALGAARADVQRLVVGQALRLTVLGMGIGLASAYALTRFMASMLTGVRPDDPPTFVGVTLMLAASALLAAWLPAARATRVDPVVALRHD